MEPVTAKGALFREYLTTVLIGSARAVSPRLRVEIDSCGLMVYSRLLSTRARGSIEQQADFNKILSNHVLYHAPRNKKIVKEIEGGSEEIRELYVLDNVHEVEGILFKDKVQLTGARGSHGDSIIFEKSEFVALSYISHEYAKGTKADGILGLGTAKHPTNGRPRFEFHEQFGTPLEENLIALAYKRSGNGAIDVGRIDWTGVVRFWQQGQTNEWCYFRNIDAVIQDGTWTIDVGVYSFDPFGESFAADDPNYSLDRIGPVAVGNHFELIYIKPFLAAAYWEAYNKDREKPLSRKVLIDKRPYYIFPCEDANNLPPFRFFIEPYYVFAVHPGSLNYSPLPHDPQWCLGSIQSDELTGGKSYFGHVFIWDRYIVYDLSGRTPTLRIGWQAGNLYTGSIKLQSMEMEGLIPEFNF